MVVVALAMLVLSGCGHRCHCNSCNTCNHPASCSTCSTCGVSDNTPPPSTCSTCSTCQTASTYDRVGAAPASLSEPVIVQAPAISYATQPAYSAPQNYSTASTYSGTSTSLERTGESRDLPVFSKPVAQIETQSAFSAPQTHQAAVILNNAPVQQTGGAGQYHTLAKGETVYALGRRYGVKPKAILEANHFNDANHLSVGTKVFIPAN
jgi:LysM repeat protein